MSNEPSPETLESPGSDIPAGDAADEAVPGDSSRTDYVPPQPPPYVQPPVRRLVRDPYSRLGGVCSGIAHHLGIDVALVRLAFVAATLFTGVGLVLYILGWLIIPRAEYWPPAPYEPGAGSSSRFEGREVAYGLLAIGIIIAVFAGGGGSARMLVSVGLVGAGIWMLVQPQQTASAQSEVAPGPGAAPTPPVGGHPPAAGTDPSSTATTVAATESTSVTAPMAPLVETDATDATTQVPPGWQPSPADVGPDVDAADDVTSGYAGSADAGSGGPQPPRTVYLPSPVPPRRRRIWPFFLILVPFALLAFVLIGALAFGAAVTDGDFSETNIDIRPTEIEDLPASIDGGAGSITVDLRSLDESDFADETLPRELRIDMNAGEVVVELPDDLPVTVDASTTAGEVTVFDDFSDGIRPRVRAAEDDAVLEIDIDLGVGEITVER